MQKRGSGIQAVRRFVQNALRRSQLGRCIMLETIVVVLGVGLLGTIVVGGLLTVIVGFGSALAESVQLHADHPHNSGRISLSH
jgi:hypothetical protein